MLSRQERPVLCKYQEIRNLWPRLEEKICFQLEKGVDLLVASSRTAVAEAVLDQLYGEDREGRSEKQLKSVGFSY